MRNNRFSDEESICNDEIATSLFEMSDFSILSSFLRSKHGTPAWQAGGAQTATISKSSEKAERGKMGKNARFREAGIKKRGKRSRLAELRRLSGALALFSMP